MTDRLVAIQEIYYGLSISLRVDVHGVIAGGRVVR